MMKKMVLELTRSKPSRIKLISRGRVLKNSETLADQGIKNGTQIMAVILAVDNNKLKEDEKRIKTLENTKKDVELLAGRSNSASGHYLQIENQSGEIMNLPYHEQKAIVTAMTLHEKGRAALKKRDFSLALVLFLEADKKYSECTSELLKSVDNYALLHLDIAWCYLCLRNPAQIPDADQRLSMCEQNFHRTYGPNLERLIIIKGTTGSEAALFMRLHLLQGVVAFHQNKRSQARALLERAQHELNGLKVNDESICLLLELGYSSSEAFIALRSTQGNVELAEEFINQRRTERKNARERNRLKLQNERERIALGLCADQKQYCEPELVKQLVAMGFDRRRSISALKLANNVLSAAIDILQYQPHLLPSCSTTVPEELVAQVVSLGVPADKAREALLKMPQLEEAIRKLNSLIRGEGTNEALAEANSSIEKILGEFWSKRKRKQEEEQQAFDRVSEDLIGNDLTDDHLNLSLAEEEQFLIEYLSLLNS
ncbi:NEDD8 ultimate buster 1-like isoform X2 [Macrosteles quadrilineatus]|uniref:NEDD8 ultimate buster 1-like isoform X2 n=1 Tax=Macrosteles quadrilineatus TaxID=74068 RepID=UPI0023E2E0B1|nr:NEDD8 ultimate buster 1-like isoform X2 [Macrosteles quadrilineatus]